MNHRVHSSAGHLPTAADASIAGVRGTSLAATLLAQVFQRFPGSIRMRLWDGTPLTVGRGKVAGQDSPFTLVIRSPEVVWTLVLGRDPLALAEAYFRGALEIEGNFFAALCLKDHLEELHLPLAAQLRAVFQAWRLRVMNAPAPGWRAAPPAHGAAPVRGAGVKRHSKSENRHAIHFHYDVSNEFYALWLDRAMVYSCAYFDDPDVSLERAQEAKLEHICRKLLLRAGESFLDIGCGWGALVIHAARHHGVRAHGVTLSPQQLQIARARIAKAGLEGRVSVELLDYRDLTGESIYDKVASVGMFEHVGLANLPIYFSKVYHVLKPGGLFLNHGITHAKEGWEKCLSTEFINRYVFPDGQLDTISNVQRVMERSKFEIADVEALRAHYALTLRHWVDRLERARSQALQFVNETTYRVWRLYMAACALQFESGEIGIYQVLAAKRTARAVPLPLTRRHLYS